MKLRLRGLGDVSKVTYWKALSLNGNPDRLTSHPILLAMTLINHFLIRSFEKITYINFLKKWGPKCSISDSFKRKFYFEFAEWKDLHSKKKLKGLSSL